MPQMSIATRATLRATPANTTPRWRDLDACAVADAHNEKLQNPCSHRKSAMNQNPKSRTTLLASTATSVAAIMASCTSNTGLVPPMQTPALGVSPPVASRPAAPTLPAVSGATSPRAYRRDAATHIYGKNAERVFQGPLPPLLYAIGVLEVEVDGQGRVTGTHWLRPPKHAPEVIAEIERTVHQAAPFPTPVRLGRVTYTDTWLWDKSGRFQLDTLTEGQL